jgi:hypothetical protein
MSYREEPISLLIMDLSVQWDHDFRVSFVQFFYQYFFIEQGLFVNNRWRSRITLRSSGSV